MTQEVLDELDRAILRQLEEDGRRAFREIARTLGTSEATVRARVKRMQDLEILRIIAFADPERLGNQQLALAMITVDPARHNDVVEALSRLPQISYVSTLLGRADICAEIATANNVELWEFLKTQVNTIKGVRTVETMSVVHVHKLRYGSTPTD
jgi:Lrp/AsnC family transcriptional regulator, regulator for asnA, asnC and gidA